MPIGTIPGGQATILAVGATSALGTEVGAVTGWSAPMQRTTDTRKYYGNTPSVVTVGPSVDTWTVNCDLTSGDTGQQFIIAQYNASTAFFIGYVDANGNGEYQQVRASQLQPQGQNPDSANTTSYAFGGIATRVAIGAGPG
jgi:hypothetical protein